MATTNYELKTDFMGLKAGHPIKGGPLDDGLGSMVVDTASGLSVPRSMLQAVTATTTTVPPAPPMPPPAQTLAGMSPEEQKAMDAVLTGNFPDLSETEATPEPEPAPPKPKPKLKKNQKWLTDYTDGRLPDSGLDHIINRYPTNHFPKEFRVDIPKENANWWWNPNVLETMIMAHEDKQPALFVGMPGTGKTDGLSQFAAILRQPFARISCKPQMEGEDLLGYPWPTGNGKMEFKLGVLPVALQNDYLICFDEVMKLNAGITMCMQELWEVNSRRIVIDQMPGTKEEKTIQASDECRIYCTDNVCGTGDNFQQFGATQIQDTSSLDRYGYTEQVPYMPKDVEVATLHKIFKKKVKKSVIDDIVKLANLIRTSYEQGSLTVTLSPRGEMVMCNLIQRGFSLQHAIDKCYRHKLGTDVERVQLDTCLQTIGINK